MKLLLPHQKINTEIDLKYANVGDLFFRMAELHQEKDFLFFPRNPDINFSYKKFKETIFSVMWNLLDLNLKKGARINIILPNSPEFILLYFAALSSGITVIPINQDLSPDEILFIIKNSSSDAVFYNHDLEKKICAIKHNLSEKTAIYKCNDIPNFELIKKTRDDEPPIPSVELTDEAVIIYTSGTTGNPKGVMLTHMNLLADAKAISDWFNFSEDTRTLGILPLFHNNGQVVTLLTPLYVGGSAVIAHSKSNLLTFWWLIEKYGVTWTSVMPAILSILLSLPLERKDSTLQGIICGGQILLRHIQDNFECRFKVPIFEGFGLTETTSFSCFNNFPAQNRKIGSIGKPLPTNEMALFNHKGEALGPNAIGEICVRGLNVANSYLGLPEKNAISFSSGWFHSGDYGYKDVDGYFYFKGRKDALIIKGGENIYPAELENVLSTHPRVIECAVVGIPDKLLGENICAFVKINDSEPVTEQQLKDFCQGKIAEFKQAKNIIVLNSKSNIQEIPKGPTKKVLYKKLREYYIQNIGE